MKLTQDQLLRKKFPLNEAMADLKRLTDNPAELGDFMQDEKPPMFILTFNHKRDNIPVADTFAEICKIIFVCSTDDPYLEDFKKELRDDEDILIFDKVDYIGDITRNGDDFGLTPPYNKVGSIARRFIDDYIRKKNIKRYIVSDNDVKVFIRKYDGKREELTDDLLKNAVRTYFYILNKYTDHFSWLNTTHIGNEFGGHIYKQGYDVASFMLYFFDKPINWRSRFHDDYLTLYLTLKESGRMAFSLPYIRVEFANPSEQGDMKEAYLQLRADSGDDYRLNRYARYFFPEFIDDVEKRGKLTKGCILKKYVTPLPDYKAKD